MSGLGSLPPAVSLMSVATQQPPSSAVVWSTGTVAATCPPAVQAATTHVAQTAPPHLGPQAGLLLSPALEVIPKKLVDKIRSGHFIDLKELLQDNISVLDQLETLQGSSGQVVGAARHRLRDISSLPTWCYCFLGFVATLTTDPVTRNQLAYARLIIREAQRQGGLAWLDYDKAFRQQLAVDPSMQWNTVNTSLLASTMLGHRSTGQGVFCSLCRGVDHTRAQCALACLEPTTPPVAPQRFLPLQAGRRPRVPPVCYAWNRGACPYDSKCNYRHVCSVCTAPAHKAVDCPQAGLPTPHPLLAHPRHP